MFLSPGQSVRLGMGGPGNPAFPHHIRTLRHILFGVLYLLFSRRVSGSVFKHRLSPWHWNILSFSSRPASVFVFHNNASYFLFSCLSPLQGLRRHTFIRKDKFGKTPREMWTLLPTPYPNRHSKGKHQEWTEHTLGVLQHNNHWSNHYHIQKNEGLILS